MGSSRLPGKVLLPLAGSAILEWVVRRASAAASLDRVAVATSTAGRDDAIVRFCLERSWPVFRGDEQDVLDRYYTGALDAGAKIVVRITADCPFIDPVVIDRVVAALTVPTPVDYASNTLEPRTFPRGMDVEAFTMAALERAWRTDANPESREHVTPHMYRNPKLYSVRQVSLLRNLSDMRWTLDTHEDYGFLVAAAALVDDMLTPWTRILRAVEEHPELLEMNRHVRQKTVEREERSTGPDGE